MNTVFLSYDDPQGSTFFYKCALELQKNISLNHIHNLTCPNLIESLAKNEDIKFYCVYSHGNEKEILDYTSQPIITLENSVHFNNSIFYSMACKTATALGIKMHQYNCTLYYGFLDTSIYVGDEDPFLQQYFIDTHNYAFQLIQAQNESIECIMKKIENYYESKIKEMRGVYDFARPWLRDNLDRLVIYHDNKTYQRK